MENTLKCHGTLKNVQTFRAEPFISVNKNAYWRLLGYPRKACGKVMCNQITLKIAF